MKYLKDMELKVKLSKGELVLQVEDSSIREDEYNVFGNFTDRGTSRRYTHSMDYFKEFVAERLDLVINDFEEYFNEQLPKFSIFDGVTYEERRYRTFEDLVSGCRDDVIVWVGDRESNFDTRDLDGVEEWIGLLTIYVEFLKVTENNGECIYTQNEVAKVIENMYYFLDNSVEWKIRYDGKELVV